jgi:hypothetical protein
MNKAAGMSCHRNCLELTHNDHNQAPLIGLLAADPFGLDGWRD